MNDLERLLNKPEFPRSAKYGTDFMLDNQMGPNALWLCEWLCESLELKPGMRILDLGCGRAMSSIFLAREFGVRVWAADLWMSPTNNWTRVVSEGMQDLVCPLRVEAHALPFAEGFFDAIVSIDSYHYFGTDELYLGYLTGFLRPGGLIGVAVPGFMQAIGNHIPDHFMRQQSNGKVFWEDEIWGFKTAAQWAEIFGHSRKLKNVKAENQTDGWRHWRDLELAIEQSGKGIFPSDAEALEWDAGRYLGFVRITAERTGVQGMNLYEPGLGMRVGAER
jgi:SAM-dependent methyltransferase